MNHRLLAVALSAVTVLLVIAGYQAMWHPDTFFLCQNIDCYGAEAVYGIAKPLYWGLWPLAILFLAMAFVPRATFVSWMKPFVVVAALSLVLVALAEPVPSGFFPGPFPDRTEAAVLAVRFLVIASAVYVLFSYVRRKRRPGR